MTAVEICEVCDEDKAAVSRSILYLEQNGFLTRGDGGDGLRKSGKRYRSALTLTDKGREAAARLAVRIDQTLDAVSHGVSEEERVILYRALGQIDRNLAALCEKREMEQDES